MRTQTSGYEKRTSSKQRAIRAAAEQLFMTRGYAAVGIQEIAKLACVSPTSIYNYFGSKKNLLIAVFEDLLVRSIQELDTYLDSDASFQEKLLRFVSKNAQSFTPEQNAAMQSFPWDDPTIQSVYRQLGEKYSLPLFRKLIRLGKAEGAIAHNLEEDAVVAYVHAFMTIMTDPGFLNTRFSYKESIHHLFFYGLLGEVPAYLDNPIDKEGE